jgi:rhamnosyltransferase subunit B
MRVLLATIGSAGDVYPMIAIGAGLRRRGHRVTVVTSPYFETAISREGLELIPLGTVEDYLSSIENPELWHPRKGFDLVARRGILPSMRPLYEIVADHDGPDTVIVASGLCVGARLAQEQLGCRLATVHAQPAMLRSLYQTPAMPGLRLPNWWPRLVKSWVFKAIDAFALDRELGPEVNAFRAELGLPPERRFFDGWLHSPARVIGLFPSWFAAPQPDWPRATELTGFLGYDTSRDGDPLPAGLEEFLAAGEPPIVFTPGTAMIHGAKFFEAAVDAVARLNRRALLLTSHRQQLPENLPASVRHFDYAPFRSVLPRAAALVHHGGIGTLSQGIAAGIPQLVMPMGHDQPDNAARIERLGAGTSLAPARFRGAAVTAKLGALLASPDVARCCRALAAKVEFDTAMKRSCDLIEDLAKHPRGASPRPVAF